MKAKITIISLIILWFCANVAIEWMILKNSLDNENGWLGLVAFFWSLFAIIPMLCAYMDELSEPI